VDSDCQAEDTVAEDTEAVSASETQQRVEQFRNVVLDESSGLYCWLWEVHEQIQAIASATDRPRFIIVGLPTGNLAVGPYQIDDDAQDDDLPINLQFDDEGEENDLANTGVRTVTEAQVHFQRSGARWLIESIDYR
jgi:hypothetical protein